MREPLGEKRLKKHATYRTYLAQLERLAVVISSVVRDIVLHRIIEREPPPLEDDVAFAVDFVMRGIGEQ